MTYIIPLKVIYLPFLISREILEYMDDENRDYIKKFNELNDIIKEASNVNISVEELSVVPSAELRLKIFDILDQINALKEYFND